jgi:hypothetical protein
LKVADSGGSSEHVLVIVSKIEGSSVCGDKRHRRLLGQNALIAVEL